MILSLNYALEWVGIAVYSASMSLAAMGHNVQGVRRPAWKAMDGHSAWTCGRTVENGVDVRRAPHYIPAKPSGARRMIHQASFLATVVFPMAVRALRRRPHVVIGVALSLIASPAALLAAKVFGAHTCSRSRIS